MNEERGEESGGSSFVGTRRMLFEKIVTDQTVASTASVKSNPARIRRPVSYVEGQRNSVLDSGKGRHHRHHHRDGVARTSSRISLRTIPLNDGGCSESDSDDGRRIEKDGKGDRWACEPSSSPERVENEPCTAVIDDPAFVKRISYHNAVFKSAELVFPKSKSTTKEEESNHRKEEMTGDEIEKTGSKEDQKKDGIDGSPLPNCTEQEVEEEKSPRPVFQVPLIKEEKLSDAEEEEFRCATDDVAQAMTVKSELRIEISDEIEEKREEVEDGDGGVMKMDSNESQISCDEKETAVNVNSSPTIESTSRRTKSSVMSYPQELNPFGDDDDDNDDECGKEKEKNIGVEKRSLNPFGSDSEFEDEPSVSEKSQKVNTNPFGSDTEDDEPNKVSPKKIPVPLPRSCRRSNVSSTSPQPSPRRSIGFEGDYSKQRLSPVPAARKLSTGSVESNVSVSRCSSSANSTLRKKKPAPPPPPLQNRNETKQKEEAVGVGEPKSNGQLDKEVPNNDSFSPSKPNRSPWKNKKGPAPARPVPIRRPVKEMPLEDIKIEINDVEIREQELERQGSQLEQMIREKTETESPEVDELMLQLFELVNEKNELFRRRTELMNMRKMHLLEKDQVELEYQIRCLMLKPASNKTDSDKEKEEELIKKLLEVVEKRNEIIEKMENDRKRETAEDHSVTTQLGNVDKSPDKKKDKKMKKNKKDKVKDEEKVHDIDKNSPSQLIKQKFLTLKHSTKKLHSKTTS